MANHLQNQKSETKSNSLSITENQRLCEDEFSDEDEIKKSRKRSATESTNQPRKTLFAYIANIPKNV